MATLRMQLIYIKRALKLKPDCAEVWNNLGNVLKEKGQIENAIENYKKAIQIKPDYAEAWNNLGSSLFEQNRFKDAIEHYRHALKLKSRLCGSMGQPWRHPGSNRRIQTGHRKLQTGIKAQT